jgi:hypothetical protein
MRGLILILLAACAGSVKRYEAPRLHHGANNDKVFAAIEATARVENWRIISSNPKVGVFEALTPEMDLMGVRTRERWLFYVSKEIVRVERLFEARFPGDEAWKSEAVVSEGYEYHRERAQLASLAALIEKAGR